MSEQFTIEIPDYLVEHMYEIAKLTGQTVNQVLAERITMDSLLPAHDVDTQLKQLHHFTDTQLWWLVALGFPNSRKEKLQLLTEQSKQSPNGLSETECLEHEQLMEEFAWYDLIRSEALVLLQERHYKIEDYLKQHRPAR